MKKKLILINSVIVFFIILILILYKIEDIISIKQETYISDEYYKVHNDIDVIFLGGSKAFNSISPLYIWNKYNIASFNRSTRGQSSITTYLFLEESFKDHNIRYAVIDISFILKGVHLDDRTQKDLSVFPLYKKIFAYLEYYDTKRALQEMNTINLFHSRWKELSKNDFKNDSILKGLANDRFKFISRKLEENDKTNYEIIDIPLYVKNTMNKFDVLAKKYNAHIIFINLPNITDNITLTKSFEKYCKQKGYDFIDYNFLLEQIHFNFNTDIRDKDHINLYGGYKVTNHLIPYLITKYNIPTHKNDSRYSSWDKDYIEYIRHINSGEIKETKSFSDWKQYANYDNYTVLLSANGDVLRKLPDTLKNDLKSFGLKKYNTNYFLKKYLIQK